MGMAASPAAAQVFDFDAWFSGLSARNLLEVELQFHPRVPGAETAIYCEDKNGFTDGWCTGSSNPLFAVTLKPGQQRSDVPGDLRIGVEWATAVGETGSGGSVIIRANEHISNAFVVSIPDDNIAHSCNKLVVSLWSLTPDRYKVAPFHDGGSIFLKYVDNDGGNPDNEPC